MDFRNERTILAALISLTCFIFSAYWYKYGRKVNTNTGNAKEIAVLFDSNSTVQRRPAGRVIWQRIAIGDKLYAKEAIRTPSDASAEITFLDSDTKIELEPDSVIVLEETSGDVALNFLKGNVFVAGGGASGLKIKSGDSVVEAGRGELNLSKGAGKDLELQVLKGNAKLNANGKSIELQKNQVGKLSSDGLEVEKDLIEIQRPLSNSKVFIDFVKKEKVGIAWKPVQGDYTFKILAGKKKENMRPFEQIQNLKGQNNELSANFKPGFVYWQLIAEPKVEGQKTLKSAVQKIKVVSVKAPVFVEPQAEQRIRLKPKKPVFEFRWTDPMKMQNAQIQVWKLDKQGKAIKASEQNASVDDNRYLQAFKESGSYAARVTGFLDIGGGKFKPISSDLVRFQVSLSNKLEPPVLKSPLKKQRIRYTRARESGLFLSWEPVPGAKSYKIRIKRPKVKGNEVDQDVVETLFDFKTFKPGEYIWSVATIGEEGKRSKFGEKRRFTVTDVPALAWSEEVEKGQSFYVGEQPKLNLSWLNGPEEVNNYRVLYSAEGQWEQAKTKLEGQLETSIQVAENGAFDVQVQALDASGQVLAQTSRKTVQVKTLPRLTRPEFDPSLEAKLDANKKGNIDLFWEGVDGATEYLIRLQKKGWDEDRFEDVRTKNLKATLKSMKPGIYNAQLFAVDKFERLSIESDERVIRVKNKSDIRAPSGIKKVKVKGVFRKRR